MNLTTNFTLQEFTRSATAERIGFENKPNARHIKAMTALCVNVLEPVRAWIRRTPQYNDAIVKITSSYRNPRLNQLVGGSKTSQHLKGEAADIEVLYPYLPNGKQMAPLIPFDTFQMIRASKIEFDQMILEFNEWVHISYRSDGRPQRRQVLVAYRDKLGKVRYTKNVAKGFSQFQNHQKWNYQDLFNSGFAN